MKTQDLYKKEVERLENKQKTELAAVKSELRAGYEYIRPINVIKRTLSKAVTSPEVQGDILKIAANMGTALLTKKIVAGDSQSPIRKWIATFLQSHVAKYVDQNENGIKLTLAKAALALLNKINLKKTPSPEGPEANVSKSAA